MKELTHKEICRELAETARTKICRVLGIAADEYDMLHYELAHQWMQKRGYAELTARVYTLSPSFHAWFRQQATFTELDMLHKFSAINQEEIIRQHRLKLINMPMVPSPALRIAFTEEGLAAIRRNDELRNIRIYGKADQ